MDCQTHSKHPLRQPRNPMAALDCTLPRVARGAQRLQVLAVEEPCVIATVANDMIHLRRRHWPRLARKALPAERLDR